MDLSEQYLLECTSDSDCNGGSLVSVFRTSVPGIPTENQYKYSPYRPYGGEICTADDKINVG